MKNFKEYLENTKLPNKEKDSKYFLELIDDRIILVITKEIERNVKHLIGTTDEWSKYLQKDIANKEFLYPYIIEKLKANLIK